MQRLLNLDVSIQPRNDGSYTCVAASSAGEAHTDFALPFTDKDLQILVLSVLGSIGRGRRKARRIQSQERQLLEDFGGQLFQAAFSGAVRNFLDRSLAAAESKDAGLRIRLRLPPELANIPWEYLYDRESAGFVSLSPETALVRYVEMPRPVRPFPISPPLRILAMISAPTDVPELQGDDEWDKLNTALNNLTDQGMVQVDRLGAGTLAALQRPLRQREYHVLHFIGHGVYDEDAQDGALALEGEDGRMRLVTGRDLGVMLKGHRSLRLVVLNACEGARSARDDPFGGVAQALVRQGIPAVIAMQFEISDPAALVFSQSFYQAIADGRPVDLAMVEARIAMFAAGHEVEWATPVLYLRSPDGQVFIKGRTPTADRQAREEADRQAREEADRQAREEADRQEADRQAREEADRQEADRQAQKAATRRARQESERKAQEAARQESERKAQEVNALAKQALRTGKNGDPAGARDQFAELLPVIERLVGPEHPSTLYIRMELARWTGEAGNPAGARDQLAALLPIQERVSGAEHPDTLAVRAVLAHWTGTVLGTDASVAARDQYAALLAIQERVLGPEHPDTLHTRGRIAFWTGTAGDWASARDQYAALLPMQERVLGPEHRDTLFTRSFIAHSTAMAGDLAGARRQYVELLPIQERVLGPEHRDTVLTRSQLKTVRSQTRWKWR
jgi:hypothetical protein